MKKIIVSLLMLMVLSFGANANIDVSDFDKSNVSKIKGYEQLSFYLRGQTVATSSYIEWTAQNVGGYSAIGIAYIDASAGNSTTFSYQSVDEYGNACGVETIGTVGTTITKITPYMLFEYNNNVAADSIVTINFNIAD